MCFEVLTWKGDEMLGAETFYSWASLAWSLGKVLWNPFCLYAASWNERHSEPTLQQVCQHWVSTKPPRGQIIPAP